MRRVRGASQTAVMVRRRSADRPRALRQLRCNESESRAKSRKVANIHKSRARTHKTGLVEGRWQCPLFHALRTQLEPRLRSEKGQERTLAPQQIPLLFDDLVGKSKQSIRDVETEYPRGLGVDHELELGRLQRPADSAAFSPLRIRPSVDAGLTTGFWTLVP